MEAAARAAGRNHGEPGELSMTRHGMLKLQAAGAQSPVTDLHASMVIADADRRVSEPEPGQHHRPVAQRSGLSASIPTLPDGGHAVPGTG